MQILPESLSILWTLWEIRVMVLLSLILQGILIINGNRRKYSCSNWLRFLWFAYLSADWVATVSLSVLSSNISSADNGTNKSIDPNSLITAFWAPFLLLHLGGPDTISAYSLEDNELWWRHLLVLVVQVSLAFYVFLRAWSGHALNFLAIPMFVAGISKFAERTWVLRSASSKHFRESMFPRPDPGPDYARYMDEYRSKADEGFKVKVGKVKEAPTIGDFSIKAPSNIPNAADLQQAHLFFQIFKKLFADLILSIHDIMNSQSFFWNISCDEAFKVIEIELGFMYDLFYTKAAFYIVKAGAIVRFISSVCIIYVFVSFLTISKQEYKEANVIITYMLLAGAIILEVYAVFRLLRSDWAMLWLTKHKKAEDLLYPIISFIPLTGDKRWSNVITKYNFIRFCLQEKPAKYCRCLPKVPWRHRTYIMAEKVPRELKELIFQQLIKKSRTEDCKKVCAYRGDRVLEKEEDKSCREKLAWSIGEEFDQSILLWHIATHLCYYSDLKIYSNSFGVPTLSDPENNSKSFCHPKCENFFGKGPKCDSDLEKYSNIFCDPNCEASKVISEYMLYLLVKRPFMLPNGIGQIRFQDTYAEAIEFFEQRECNGAAKACDELLAVNTKIDPAEVKGDRSKSVLFNACKLANALQSLETEQKWENQKKWELISQVWVEMLSYAASQCRWNHHARQLRRGGQLLTHVWLLMAHLGITQQIRTFKFEMAKLEHS